MANSRPSDVIIVGNFSDDPFAIDVAYTVGQTEDIADLIAMKNFANSEFCPRFISDEDDLEPAGTRLELLDLDGQVLVMETLVIGIGPVIGRHDLDQDQVEYEEHHDAECYRHSHCPA